MNILVVMQIEEYQKEVLKKAAPEADILYIPANQVTREQAQEADVIVGNIAPDLIKECKNLKLLQLNSAGTETTYKIFDAQAFSHMKDGAYFLNVGRGNAVDTDALYDALKTGKLAGAALDVTDPEPLPTNHKLWDAPGVLITPHISGGYHLKQTHDRIIEIAARNIGHLLKNEPYENEVDFTTGYKK